MCFLTGLRLLKRKLKMHRKRGIKVHHSERDKTECSEDIPSQTHQPRLMRCIIELRFRLHAFVRLAAVCRMSFGLKPSCLRRFSLPPRRRSGFEFKIRAVRQIYAENGFMSLRQSMRDAGLPSKQNSRINTRGFAASRI